MPRPRDWTADPSPTRPSTSRRSGRSSSDAPRFDDDVSSDPGGAGSAWAASPALRPWRVLGRLPGARAAIVALALVVPMLAAALPDPRVAGTQNMSMAIAAPAERQSFVEAPPAVDLPPDARRPADASDVPPVPVDGRVDPVEEPGSTIGLRVGDRPIGLDAPREVRVDRADKLILAWLPEILAASKKTGVSPSLIAGVMRVESQGNPKAVSPDGARGLMQVMPMHLRAQGVPKARWSDPATNILAGARLLGWNIEVYGSDWDAVAHYFGIGCDVFSCTDGYVNNVLAWDAHYATLIAAS